MNITTFIIGELIRSRLFLRNGHYSRLAFGGLAIVLCLRKRCKGLGCRGEYIQFIRIAFSSGAELETQLLIAKKQVC